MNLGCYIASQIVKSMVVFFKNNRKNIVDKLTISAIKIKDLKCLEYEFVPENKIK